MSFSKKLRIAGRAAFPAILFGVLPLSSTLAADQSVAWKSDQALVFLHRSAGMVAPENTIPAFEAAVRQGADGIETDIRKTRDGVFVIYHDDWVLRQRGPAGKIEEMMLAETQSLDVGERFGPQWRGLHPSLFEDLLRFAKANDLGLYLDIKSPGIYEEVMQIVEKLGCMPLVHATGGQVPQKHFALPIPWIAGWNYTEGGEEDPDRMREVINRAPKGTYGIMCDDARSIVRALGRHPENRPFRPFVSTMTHQLRIHRFMPVDITAIGPLLSLHSEHPKLRRSACLNLSRRKDRSALQELLTVAESDIDFAVRQDACWALGSLRDDRSIPTLLRIAQTPYDQKTAAQTDYRDFFLKTAAGCALARIDSAAARTALKTLLDSAMEGDRSAAAIGLAVFGSAKDLETLRSLVGPGPANDGIVGSIVVGYAGRFGMKALPVYLAALQRDDVAKQAVFGLAALGRNALPSLKKELTESVSTIVRRRVSLTVDWINEQVR